MKTFLLLASMTFTVNLIAKCSAYANCEENLIVNRTWISAYENAPHYKNYNSSKPTAQRFLHIKKTSDLLNESNRNGAYNIHEFVSETRDGMERLSESFYKADHDSNSCVITLVFLTDVHSSNQIKKSDLVVGAKQYIKILNLAKNDDGGISTYDMQVRYCLDSSCDAGEVRHFFGR